MKRSTLVGAILAVVLLQSAHAQTPPPSSVSFDIAFLQRGPALAIVEKAIGAAKSEILIACYEFTSRDIAEALESAAHRGVKVRVVADWKAAHDRFSQTGILREAGIPVRLDHRYAIFHHKFIVVDGATLETGSFNYTTAAIKHNAENAIVLWDAPTIAEAYATEWQRLWDESVDVKQ